MNASASSSASFPGQVLWTAPACGPAESASHPFLQWLGAEWVRHGDDGARVLRLKLEAHHANPWGVAHGGVVSALLDSVMAQALRRAWHPDAPSSVGLVTLDIQIRYFLPAQGVLVAVPEVLNAQATTGQAQAWLWCLDGPGPARRAAMATGSFQRLRALPAKRGQAVGGDGPGTSAPASALAGTPPTAPAPAPAPTALPSSASPPGASPGAPAGRTPHLSSSLPGPISGQVPLFLPGD